MRERGRKESRRLENKVKLGGRVLSLPALALCDSFFHFLPPRRYTVLGHTSSPTSIPKVPTYLPTAGHEVLILNSSRCTTWQASPTTYTRVPILHKVSSQLRASRSFDSHCAVHTSSVLDWVLDFFASTATSLHVHLHCSALHHQCRSPHEHAEASTRYSL